MSINVGAPAPAPLPKSPDPLPEVKTPTAATGTAAAQTGDAAKTASASVNQTQTVTDSMGFNDKGVTFTHTETTSTTTQVTIPFPSVEQSGTAPGQGLKVGESPFGSNAVTTAGGYTIVPTGKEAGWDIYAPGQKPGDKPLTHVYGDPHVEEKDGTKWDFTKSPIFNLPDGTKIFCQTTSDQGQSVTKGLDIVNGADHVSVTGIDKDAPQVSTVKTDGHEAKTGWPSSDIFHLAGDENTQRYVKEHNGELLGEITGSTQDANKTYSQTVNANNKDLSTSGALTKPATTAAQAPTTGAASQTPSTSTPSTSSPSTSSPSAGATSGTGAAQGTQSTDPTQQMFQLMQQFMALMQQMVAQRAQGGAGGVPSTGATPGTSGTPAQGGTQQAQSPACNVNPQNGRMMLQQMMQAMMQLFQMMMQQMMMMSQVRGQGASVAG